MLPNAAGYEHNPEKLRQLIRRSGLSQRRIAAMLRLSYRTLKHYLHRRGSQAPYTVYYAITVLALVNEKIGQPLPPRRSKGEVS